MRMRQFEKAANEIDNDIYTGDCVQENCIEWIKGSKTATVTFPKGRFTTKVMKLAEQYPDEVQICDVNKDGSIVAHIPVSYILVRHPKVMNLSDERRQALSEQGKRIARRTNNISEGL